MATNDSDQRPREPIFRKFQRADILPGWVISVYESRDCPDVYYATREACQLVGYSADWLTTALRRESSRSELQRLGMALPLPVVKVKTGHFKRFVKVLSFHNLKVIAEYGSDAGYTSAIALHQHFSSQKTC